MPPDFATIKKSAFINKREKPKLILKMSTQKPVEWVTALITR